MKKIVLSLIGLVAIAIAAGCLYSVAANLDNGIDFSRKTTLRGSGNIITRTFEVGEFDAIHARSAVSVQLVKGSGPVTVKTDDNVMEYIEVAVKDGTLALGFKQGSYERHNVSVEITVPTDGNMKGVKVSGAAKLVAEPILSADEIELKASGAAKMAVLVNAKKCEIDVSGASRVEVGGAAEQCEADASGASRLKLVLKTVICDLDTSGASRIEAIGSAHDLFAEASGASNITADELVATNCKASTSCASKIAVNCTDKLTASASSAGHITYKNSGSGVLETHFSTSSAGSVSER